MAHNHCRIAPRTALSTRQTELHVYKSAHHAKLHQCFMTMEHATLLQTLDVEHDEEKWGVPGKYHRSIQIPSQHFGSNSSPFARDSSILCA